MEIRKFRIGNLLLADIGIVRINAILEHNLRVHAQSITESYSADYSIGHLQPILLTSEIMAQNGWHWDGFYWHREHFKLCREYNLIIVGPGGFGTIVGRNVKYVHLLQNKYYWLTDGRELEFKF